MSAAATPYAFTSRQLQEALMGALELYVEYRYTHGHDDRSARLCAVGEVLSGLDAERELVAMGEQDEMRLQLPYCTCQANR
jgi:hypothetical protein